MREQEKPNQHDTHQPSIQKSSVSVSTFESVSFCNRIRSRLLRVDSFDKSLTNEQNGYFQGRIRVKRQVDGKYQMDIMILFS